MGEETREVQEPQGVQSQEGSEAQGVQGTEAQEAKGKKKGAIIALVALVAIVAVAVFAYSALPGLRGGTPYDLTPADELDPLARTTIAACTIKDNDDNALTIGDITAKSHKPIVMNVWASWCSHCVEEMNDYQKLFDEYGDRVDFVMLDLNDKPVELDSARGFVKEHGFTFPVYFDTNSSVREALGITGIPMSAVLSSDGDLLLVRSGVIKYDAMKATIESILNA